MVDKYLREVLASLVKPTPESPDLYIERGDLKQSIIDLGLNQIDSLGLLLNNTDNVGAKFIAEIAFEFAHRRPTNTKFKSWDTGRLSEYITRKIIRQIEATKNKEGKAEDPWWMHEFLRHILLGIGPWPVGDDVDDASTSEMSTAPAHDEKRSFGTGPWPRNDGTG